MNRYKLINGADILSMLKKNYEDNLTNNQIRNNRDNNYNPYPNGRNMHDFSREINTDMKVDGFLVTYPHGSVIKQADRSFHYRGENQIHGSSQATLYRKLKGIKNKEEKFVEEFVAYMRIAEFLDLILKMKHTQEFLSLRLSVNGHPLKIDLLYEQIAQHYGLNTPWLDITSDFEVALFFSCCRFDNSSKKWVPLTNKDFNESEDTKYGVIFRRATEHPSNFFPSSQIQSIEVFPNGFQPFMRCHMQSSYVAISDKCYSLQSDSTFEKLHFKHTEDLCNFIYERMEGGGKIYPHEGLNIMSDEIGSITNRTVFTLDAFNYVLGENMYKLLNKEKTKELLSKYGYELVDASNYFSKKKIETINKLYQDFDIEKTYNINLRTRMTYTPPE